MTNVFDQDQRARNTLLSKGYVSRETLTLLDRFVELLRLWQSRTNLVASSSLHDVWSRHILDSAQLLQICPKARLWVDLGSGGGFPGLVIACAMREAAGHVHLVESNGKKAGFLRHVSTSLQLPCTIHAERIEADLDTLLSLASSLLKRGAIGLFPKGRDHAVELTKAAEHWHFSSKLHVSHTDPDARVIEIMNFQG